MLNSITWNVKPQIVDLGFLEIRWYGLLFAAAFFMSYVVLSKFFKKEGIKVELLDKLTLYMFLGTLIGARLGHCLFYQPMEYLKNPIDILKVWEGGLASHGAAVGILIALYLFVRKRDMTYLWILDRIGIVVALSGFFIRTGNLMNSEIVGHSTDAPWGFIFTRLGEDYARHPTQIYEALSYLFIFGLLMLLYYKTQIIKKQGLMFGILLTLLFSARFLIEFVKDIQVDFENTMSLNMGQLLSIPLILAGLALIFTKAFKPIKE